MKIFRGTTGLNNKIDPIRHKFNPDTGITELTAGINIEIDRYGGIDRRLGQTVVVDDVFHSGYCNGGDAYVVQDRTNDAAIYQVATDDTLTGIASGLTKGYRVSFWQVGEKTYWMNGAQKGMLYLGGSYAWPTVATHVGVESSAEYYPAPLGTHICVFRGRMCVVVGDTVYVSEPYSYGEFRMSACYWRFPSAVTMIKPTPGGLWVSDSDQIGFIAAAEKFEAMTWVKKASVPAHEWSECIMLADLSRTVYQIQGMSALWSSDEGLCIGTETGQFIVATADKLVYPTGGDAATVMFGDMVINSVGSAVQEIVETLITVNGSPWNQQGMFNATIQSDITGWSQDGTIPTVHNVGQCFVTKNRVYLPSSSSAASVYMAEIDGSGDIVVWSVVPSILPVIQEAGSLITTSRAYILGGYNSNKIYYANVDESGILGAWVLDINTLPVQARGCPFFIVKGKAYFINLGYTYAANIDEDGVLGIFSDTGLNLHPNYSTVGTFQSSVIITNSRVYIVGAYKAPTYYQNVMYAEYDSDGVLGEWITDTNFPIPVAYSGVAVTKNYAFVIGGYTTGSVKTSKVFAAPISQSGTIGSWTEKTSVVSAVAPEHTIITSSKIYLISDFNTNKIYSAFFTGGQNDYTQEVYEVA